MHYRRPAIEARTETKAFLGRVSGGGGDSQPVWRTGESVMPYERPAIEGRAELKAQLGVVSGGGGDIAILQPVWRTEKGDDDQEQ